MSTEPEDHNELLGDYADDDTLADDDATYEYEDREYMRLLYTQYATVDFPVLTVWE